MTTLLRVSLRLAVAGVLTLAVMPQQQLSAQDAPGVGAGGSKDLPLTAAQRALYVGTYPLERTDGRRMAIRVFELHGHLMVEPEGQPARRMLYQGDQRFHPEGTPDFPLTFTLSEGEPPKLTVYRDEMTLQGVRGQAPPSPDGQITAADRKQVIDGVMSRLDAAYVFPDKAKTMGADLRARQQRGEYDAMTNGPTFAMALTEHLRAISHDKHLSVSYNSDPTPAHRPDANSTPEMRARLASQLRERNFFYEKPQVLAGNIGYVELRQFAPADVEGAEEVVATVMTAVANTDALIIDLRRNGGGNPDMVRLLSSYLFGSTPVHLNSLYWRPSNSTEEFWTLREVKGDRFGPDKPVYVLTSSRTFSGAEEFTYNLKTRKRATIVGETTGGGAHPGGLQRVTDHFGVWVPSGRAINPITKTNWEGTGVAPDVAVPQEKALTTAHLQALRTVLAGSRDASRKRELQRAIKELEGTTGE